MRHAIVRRRAVVRAKIGAVGAVKAATLRSEKAQVLYARTRVAFVRMVATTPFQPWVAEDVVRATRSRSLLEDNPTSG